MSDSELAVVVPQTFPVPALIERAGASTRKRFFEFFAVPIRNAHTRAAYYRSIQQFLAWVERAGYQDLEDIEPNFLENDGTLEAAQRIAGHADSRTTKLYDRRGQKVLLEDMERIRY
jgi:hypothetical protein